MIVIWQIKLITQENLNFMIKITLFIFFIEIVLTTRSILSKM